MEGCAQDLQEEADCCGERLVGAGVGQADGGVGAGVGVLRGVAEGGGVEEELERGLVGHGDGGRF